MAGLLGAILMGVHIVGTLLGLWLMAAPDILGYGGRAGINDHILGPIVAASACIAISEATRAVRWVNLPIGAWLVLAPLVLGHERVPLLNSMVVGGLLVVAAMTRGAIRHRFGGGWSSLWGPGDPALRRMG